MSILSFIHSPPIEADVLKVVAGVGKAEAVAKADLDKAVNWLVGEAPTITNDINILIGVVALSGGATNPQAAAAVAAANVAVQTLNALVASHNAGQSSVATVISGYAALKKAVASTALATAVSLPSVAVPATPATPLTPASA